MAIAGFIEKGARVADIGTDHGHLPVFLAQSGLASSIIASDMSGGSLKSAIASADKYGVSDKITFVTASGLAGVSVADVDTIVISGLGGETISSILEDAPWTKSPDVRLILQPQTKLGKLCTWLRDNGYSVKDARHVKDRGRVYTVLLVVYGA